MSITSTLRPSALGAVGTDASDLEALCAHCRLPVLESPLEISDDHQFCCAGCRTAFTILHDHGLDQFYRFGERRGVRVTSSGRTFDEFDHEAFQALYVRQTTAGLSSVELYLEGVHCASCVWLVERVPLVLAGVVRAELNVPRSLATLEWDPQYATLGSAARLLESLGYTPHPYRGARTDELRRKEDRAAIARIGVAGTIAVNVM